MGNLHVFSIIYISGVFLGLLHCYPLLGEESSSQDQVDNDVIDGTHQNVVTSPRLQRLIKTYVHLLRLDQQGLGTSGLGKFQKLDAPWEDNSELDFEPISNQHDQVDFGAEADDDTRKLKRQQGWHIQYGKRSSDSTTESNRPNLRDEFTKASSSSRRSSEFRRQITERMAGILKDIFILANEVQRGDYGVPRAEDTHDIVQQITDGSPMTMAEKRQQGWYIQYGKRSNPGYASL